MQCVGRQAPPDARCSGAADLVLLSFSSSCLRIPTRFHSLLPPFLPLSLSLQLTANRRSFLSPSFHFHSDSDHPNSGPPECPCLLRLCVWPSAPDSALHLVRWIQISSNWARTDLDRPWSGLASLSARLRGGRKTLSAIRYHPSGYHGVLFGKLNFMNAIPIK